MPHDPCNTPLIKPRERIGQLSIANAAPAGHSAPIPKPNKARNTNRNQKVGEKPAMKLPSEYHRIEIINGSRRPTRSPSHPELTAPTSRIHKVTVKTTATSVSGTPNSCEIGSMINRKRDWQHDQQEDREIKSIQGPAQPSGDPGQPLILGWLFPPWKGFYASIAALRYLPSSVGRVCRSL